MLAACVIGPPAAPPTSAASDSGCSQSSTTAFATGRPRRRPEGGGGGSNTGKDAGQTGARAGTGVTGGLRESPSPTQTRSDTPSRMVSLSQQAGKSCATRSQGLTGRRSRGRSACALRAVDMRLSAEVWRSGASAVRHGSGAGIEPITNSCTPQWASRRGHLRPQQCAAGRVGSSDGGAWTRDSPL